MKNSTKHLSFRRLLSFVAFVAIGTPLFATARENGPVDHNLVDQKQAAPTSSMSAAPAVNEVYSWAKDAQQKLPALEIWTKVRTKTETDRSLVRLVKRGQDLVNRVVERGPGISAKEASSYDAQMRMIVGQIDKLTSGSVAGDTSGCIKGCDTNYKGWGKGKGWNRFWCKAGCIKVKVGPVGVG